MSHGKTAIGYTTLSSAHSLHVYLHIYLIYYYTQYTNSLCAYKLWFTIRIPHHLDYNDSLSFICRISFHHFTLHICKTRLVTTKLLTLKRLGPIYRLFDMYSDITQAVFLSIRFLYINQVILKNDQHYLLIMSHGKTAIENTTLSSAHSLHVYLHIYLLYYYAHQFTNSLCAYKLWCTIRIPHHLDHNDSLSFICRISFHHFTLHICKTL